MPTSFRCAGGTGQAPTTTFFGAVPDRLNMLYPWNSRLTAQVYNWLSLTVANNVNQWNIYNTSLDGGANVNTVSLGSLTTAPDGTNTAQHITESNATSVHLLQAGFTTSAINLFPFFPSGAAGSTFVTVRLAVFAKADTRTRIVLAVLSGESPTSGCRTVFDLAGGQIGVANTAFGAVAGWTPGETSITPFGSGWYRCMMDATVGTSSPLYNNIFGYFYLDAGLGTAAENSNYLGNGTSGVYAWRSTMLPPAAWSINTQIFFDDFTSSSTIDLTNSLAPGFNWYINGNWPNLSPPVSPTNTSTLSVASSILNMTGDARPFQLMSAAWLGSGSNTVGRGYTTQQGPLLFESKFAFNVANYNSNTNSAQGAWWADSIQGLLSLGPPNTSNPVPELEIDFNEFCGFAGNQFGHRAIFSNYLQEGAQGAAFNNYVVWNSGTNFTSGVGEQVFYSGQIYHSLVNPNVGNVPATSPGQWQVVASPFVPTLTPVDVTQQHVYTTLWIPYKKGNVGWYIWFVDGGVVQHNSTAGDFTYGPNTPPVSNAGFFVADGQTMTIILAGLNPSPPVPPVTFSVDYVKVMQ